MIGLFSTYSMLATTWTSSPHSLFFTFYFLFLMPCIYFLIVPDISSFFIFIPAPHSLLTPVCSVSQASCYPSNTHLLTLKTIQRIFYMTRVIPSLQVPTELFPRPLYWTVTSPHVFPIYLLRAPLIRCLFHGHFLISCP